MIKQRKGVLRRHVAGSRCGFCGAIVAKLYGPPNGQQRLFCEDCMHDPQGTVEQRGKICSGCGELKSVLEYTPTDAHPCGCDHTCRACDRLNAKRKRERLAVPPKRRDGVLALEGHNLKCQFCNESVTVLYNNRQGRKRLYCVDCMNNPVKTVEKRGKVCCQCDEHKPVKEFPREPRNICGYDYTCLECHRHKVQTWRDEKRSRAAQEERERGEKARREKVKQNASGLLLRPRTWS